MSNNIGPISRRPGRRDFLSIGTATVAVVAGIKVPSSVAAVADPLPALCARRAEIDAICNTPGPVPGCERLFDEWASLLERIADTVPATRAGLIAQIRFLAWFREHFE